jgi:hypothetical protein
MLGISPYSYSYLDYQKCFVFLIIFYTISSTKLEISAEQFLPGSKGVWGRWSKWRGEGWGGR